MIKEFDKYDMWGPYHWLWGSRKRHWYNRMIEFSLSHLTDKGSILDIGCGDGYVSAILKDKGFKVEGVDSNAKAISLAKTLLQDVNFYLTNIEELNIDKKYDYLYAQNVIEHMQDYKKIREVFERYCDKYMILITDMKGKLGRYEYSNVTFEDLKELFKEYKVELLFEYRKAYAVRISK